MTANLNRPQRPRTRAPWLAMLLLGGSVLAGFGYLWMRPGPSAPEDRAAQRSAPAPAPGSPRTTLERITQTTDRDELLNIAETEPPYRVDVETRLNVLGYHRLLDLKAEVWLRSGLDGSFRECVDCPEMAVLPVARFLMGSPNTEAGRQEDEDDTPGPGGNPVSVTIVRAFAIGKYEVTRGQFAAFVKSTGYRMDPGCYAREGSVQLRPELSWTAPGFEQDDRHPVTCVSWLDAAAYVRWLSATTGAAYRLPTEAEWEYAARGGSTTPFAYGNADAQLCKHGNGADLTSKEADPDWTAALCRDGFRFTAPVGSFRSNAFGLYDMHGNVWEWVADCQSTSLAHLSTPERTPIPPCASDTPRILRGGSWSDPPQRLRSAARIAGPPDARDSIVGFRVGRTLETGQ